MARAKKILKYFNFFYKNGKTEAKIFSFLNYFSHIVKRLSIRCLKQETELTSLATELMES